LKRYKPFFEKIQPFRKGAVFLYPNLVSLPCPFSKGYKKRGEKEYIHQFLSGKRRDTRTVLKKKIYKYISIIRISLLWRLYLLNI
jgi:hypothetical protein